MYVSLKDGGVICVSEILHPHVWELLQVCHFKSLTRSKEIFLEKEFKTKPTSVRVTANRCLGFFFRGVTTGWTVVSVLLRHLARSLSPLLSWGRAGRPRTRLNLRSDGGEISGMKEGGNEGPCWEVTQLSDPVCSSGCLTQTTTALLSVSHKSPWPVWKCVYLLKWFAFCLHFHWMHFWCCTSTFQINS